ncbi:MAG: methyltransferase domain-containing protein [Desulfovibrionaceae bacterium]|nr:methyltransferase domain-containing protein [Desulfovibrionaceae bacterium]
MPDVSRLMKVEEKRFVAEIKHGKWLLENDPAMQWGWGTPAGQLRAKRRGQLIAQGAKLAPGMRALEIGCGTGLFTEMFSKYGAHILAVDLSPDLLSAARQKNVPAGQVEFLEAPFEDCDAQSPFDAIIGSSILHHLDCGKSFAKMYQLLKPGGVISFCEPNMLNPQIWFTLRFRRFFPNISPDETAFYRKSLYIILQKVGFIKIRITPFDWLHPQVPEKLIPLVKKVENFIEKLPGVKEFAGSLWLTAQRPNDKIS